MILGSGSGARSNGGRLCKAPRLWAAILINMLYYLHSVPFYEPRGSTFELYHHASTEAKCSWIFRGKKSLHISLSGSGILLLLDARDSANGRLPRVRAGSHRLNFNGLTWSCGIFEFQHFTCSVSDGRIRNSVVVILSSHAYGA